MPGDTAHTRTIRRAIEALGGAQRLAQALGASVAEIESWSTRLAVPPPGVFLHAIDIVAHAGFVARRSAKS